MKHRSLQNLLLMYVNRSASSKKKNDAGEETQGFGRNDSGEDYMIKASPTPMGKGLSLEERIAQLVKASDETKQRAKKAATYYYSGRG